MGRYQALWERLKGMWVVKAAILGEVPAFSQRPPQLVLLRVDDLTQHPQGRHCQQGRDHRRRHVCRILRHHLWKNGGSKHKLFMLRWRNESEISLEELTMPKLLKKIWTKSGAVGLDSVPSSWPCNMKKFFSHTLLLSAAITSPSQLWSICNQLI